MRAEQEHPEAARVRQNMAALRSEFLLDHRGHLFDRSVEGDMPVLRCRYGDCGFVWYPDEHKPRRECRSEMVTP